MGIPVHTIDSQFVLIKFCINFSNMKTTLLATLFASAAAFAPVSQKTSSSALNAFEGELGARTFYFLYNVDLADWASSN
jgi:hypothetical protein